ncbi:MAG: 50S ribosomal protein L30 [Clostridia bacterium]|nr:50S ribosomal protein L30 [Clostridia bacterium]
MLKIKLVKSVSGRLEKQQKTVAALGLTKIGSETVKPDNACTRGMIFVVKHLVEFTSVKEN